MFVRMKVGRYAGEILDVRNDAAVDLLASNRAENPYAPPAPVAEVKDPVVERVVISPRIAARNVKKGKR